MNEPYQPSLDKIDSLPNGGVLVQGDAASACACHDGFDLIVLCAEEFPVFKVKAFHPPNARARLLYAPNDDATLTGRQLCVAMQAAQIVSIAVMRGQKVLVTCMQGRNRSGLVSALAVHMLYGMSGRNAANLVRRRRTKAMALTNDSFNSLLNRIPHLQNGGLVGLPNGGTVIGRAVPRSSLQAR